MTDDKTKLTGGEIAGGVFGDISAGGNMYYHDKYASPRGHGFAAEDANHVHDVLHGKHAKLVGTDNSKNGADRIVNGTEIQTKFCKTGSKCVSECFTDGKFRYISSNGQPMKIEVPKDNYDFAVQAMKNRIKNGQVPGVTDPEKASDIIQQSPYTYQQARNIAKAGNIDSIKFDSQTGMIVSLSAMGISSTISFAISIWNGEDFDVAIENATLSGLKVGGLTFVSSVLSSQLSKAGLNSALVNSSEAVTQLIGPKASAILVNAFRSGNSIYGAAAMKSAAKLLRGNVITGVVTGVILSSGDIANMFSGRISGKQLFKNVSNTAATIAGGTAGYVGGTAAATALGATIGSVIPGLGTLIGGAVGTVIGGLTGSVLGGTVAAKATSSVLDEFIEDDAEEMVNIIEKRFKIFATDYLVNSSEADNVVDKLHDKLTGDTLKDMFSSSNRNSFADNLLRPIFEEVIRERPTIKAPTAKELTLGLQELLENSGATA